MGVVGSHEVAWYSILEVEALHMSGQFLDNLVSFWSEVQGSGVELTCSYSTNQITGFYLCEILVCDIKGTF